MLEKFKEKIGSIRRPNFRNPLRTEKVGKAIYERLQSMSPSQAEEEWKTYDEITKRLYLDHVYNIRTRDFVRVFVGSAFVGVVVGGVALLLSSDLEVDEDEDEDEDDEIDRLLEEGTDKSEPESD